MTKLLERAFYEASRLTEGEQEAFAAFLLEELASERRWSEAFANSQDTLAALADEALEEFRRGKTNFVRFLRRKAREESFNGLLLSESALATDWNTPEEDAAWANL